MSTPTPAPKKQQPKKSGPPKSGTSGGKTDKTGKGKKPVTGKTTSTSTGKSKAKTAQPGTTPPAPLSPYVAPTGRAVLTPGDGNCL
ncbi:hypothetical protein JHN63_51670, partial [Streptomyces sp. MBT65]|nr:hypothetical protein [Streptomyces sp. MBT65]